MADSGARGVMKGMTLKRALAIKKNKYRSVQTVAGSRKEIDYSKEEIDEFILSAQEKKAENLSKKQREVSIHELPLFKNKELYGIIQNHINEIHDLEEKEAKKLISKYRKIRGIMRDRLDFLKGDTFSAQRLRGAMIQVETALVEMNNILKDGMTEAGQVAALKGINHLYTELDKFNNEFTGAVIPIDINAALIASDVTNLLMSKYETSLEAYSADVRARISAGMTASVVEKASYSEVIQRMSVFFQHEEWKLHRIARTEIHSIYNTSKQMGLFDIKERHIPDLKKTLIHPMDARTGEDSKQAAEKALIVDIEDPFEYTYVRYRKDGSKVEEKRVFMTPPDRPNDRSILVPYREEWEE